MRGRTAELTVVSALALILTLAVGAESYIDRKLGAIASAAEQLEPDTHFACPKIMPVRAAVIHVAVTRVLGDQDLDRPTQQLVA